MLQPQITDATATNTQMLELTEFSQDLQAFVGEFAGFQQQLA